MKWSKGFFWLVFFAGVLASQFLDEWEEDPPRPPSPAPAPNIPSPVAPGPATSPEPEITQDEPFDGLMYGLQYDLLRDTPERNQYVTERVREHDWPNLYTAITRFNRATNLKFYPDNSFLVGYAPFRTGDLAGPLNTVATRLTYGYDVKTFKALRTPHSGGLSDVWQTSRQAYQLMRGDCEDHAILLTDWLLEEGFDAVVVCGKAQSSDSPTGWGGHCWSELNLRGKWYLLEATAKPIRQRLASSLAHKYRSQIRFNREQFWIHERLLEKFEFLDKLYGELEFDKGWLEVGRFIRQWPIDMREGQAAQLAAWTALAEVGDPMASYLLGLRYRDGNGVERDRDKAEHLLTRAASQGLEVARTTLEQLR